MRDDDDTGRRLCDTNTDMIHTPKPLIYCAYVDSVQDTGLSGCGMSPEDSQGHHVLYPMWNVATFGSMSNRCSAARHHVRTYRRFIWCTYLVAVERALTVVPVAWSMAARYL